MLAHTTALDQFWRGDEKIVLVCLAQKCSGFGDGGGGSSGGVGGVGGVGGDSGSMTMDVFLSPL